jgi:hypothetical protein
VIGFLASSSADAPSGPVAAIYVAWSNLDLRSNGRDFRQPHPVVHEKVSACEEVESVSYCRSMAW